MKLLWEKTHRLRTGRVWVDACKDKRKFLEKGGGRTYKKGLWSFFQKVETEAEKELSHMLRGPL